MLQLLVPLVLQLGEGEILALVLAVRLGLALSLVALVLALPYSYKMNWLWWLCCCDASITVDNHPFLESSFDFTHNHLVARPALCLLPSSTYLYSWL